MAPLPVPLRALVLVLALVTAAGCTTWRGARLYQSGTDALDAGDGDRAVAELEEAAVLVPHASEIQNHLGLAYDATGREEDALRAYRRAVELDCENAAAESNLRAAEDRALRAAHGSGELP